METKVSSYCIVSHILYKKTGVLYKLLVIMIRNPVFLSVAVFFGRLTWSIKHLHLCFVSSCVPSSAYSEKHTHAHTHTWMFVVVNVHFLVCNVTPTSCRELILTHLDMPTSSFSQDLCVPLMDDEFIVVDDLILMNPPTQKKGV